METLRLGSSLTRQDKACSRSEEHTMTYILECLQIYIYIVPFCWALENGSTEQKNIGGGGSTLASAAVGSVLSAALATDCDWTSVSPVEV